MIKKYKYPIEDKIRVFKEEKDWSRIERYTKKLQFILINMGIYIKDIAFWRTDAISYKTAEFVKRNYNWIKNMIGHLIIEVRHVIHGFKKFKNDVKFALGIRIKES